MRRVASILLLLTLACVGTGLLEYLHNLEHLREDAAADAGVAHELGKPGPQPIHHHNESNCFVHAQLHLARIITGWVPLLVLLGLFVAFLTQIAQPLISRRFCFSVDCRGPPVC